MKITKSKIKKHARNIRNVSEEEFKELQEGYRKLVGNVQTMTSPMLMALSLLGVFVILYFRSNFMDIIGLLIFVYPFYLFVQKESHEEGFFEGYYDQMSKKGSSHDDKSAKEDEKSSEK